MPPSRTAPAVRLAPLSERTFQATYMLATRMHTKYSTRAAAGELDALIRAARELQDELTGAASK